MLCRQASRLWRSPLSRGVHDIPAIVPKHIKCPAYAHTGIADETASPTTLPILKDEPMLAKLRYLCTLRNVMFGSCYKDFLLHKKKPSCVGRVGIYFPLCLSEFYHCLVVLKGSDRQAGILASEMRSYAGSLVKAGVTTQEINIKVHDAIIKRGAYPSPLNYFGFPKSLFISGTSSCIGNK